MKKYINLTLGIIFLVIACFSDIISMMIYDSSKAKYIIGAILGIGGLLLFISGLVGVIKNVKNKPKK